MDEQNLEAGGEGKMADRDRLTKFLDLPLDYLAQFDFKELNPYMPAPPWAGPSLKLWLEYRAGKNFDCDRCLLAREIYAILWNNRERPKRGGYWDLKTFQENKTPPKLFRPDTMNSMATTWNAYNKHNLKNEKLNSQWEKFAKNVSCIGNFALVPDGFNSYRNNQVKDYWDKSLFLLYEDDANFHNSGVWEKKDFKKYINAFFLWDYIGDESKPIELFERTDNSFSPKTEKEFQDFLTNVNRLIERRSIFMAAMLKIAVEQEDVYKAIMNELTSKDAIYASDLEKATEQLKEKFEESDENGILNDAIDKIKKIKLER